MAEIEGKVDCLFVHVPKCSNEYLPLGEFMNVTYMPMGLPALAEYAARHGFRTEIIHLGVEWMLDPTYRIAEELSARDVRAVGLPLYWHYQAYDVLRVAAAIRAASPSTFLFLGGLTASYFAEEIMRDFDCVDAVVQGHGEKPIVALLHELSLPEPNLGNVPSLWYRAAGKIRRSTADYAAEASDLDELVFGDLSYLRHADTYVRSFGFPLAFSKEYTAAEHRGHNTMGRPFFPLCTGRGCPTRCSYCGGSHGTLSRCNGSGKVLWRSPAAVVEDMRRALDAGYQTASLCFDAPPESDAYYIDLFERIRAARLPIDLYFENWGLPTPEFLRSFAKTFEPPHSYIAFSPDSGNEAVRKRNKGFSYSNQDLRRALREAEGLGVQVDVFFSIALPGERLREALETRDLIAALREEYSNIRRLMTWSVQLEPGSPMYEQPARYGLVTDRHGFMDFYRAHGGPNADTYSSLGFKILDYFGDERDLGGIPEFEAHLQHLKCMEFCFLSPDPRQRLTPAEARLHCLERRTRVAQRRGVTQPQRVISDEHRYADAADALRAGLPESPRAEWI